jgi:6-phosphofructo-2-kinase/fructose-2,6-biphosphatase
MLCQWRCRLGHNTAHFNVGNYRRLQKEANEVQDASFFDSHNKVCKC